MYAVNVSVCVSKKVIYELGKEKLSFRGILFHNTLHLPGLCNTELF